jgi:RNA polymerase sigma factor (TIGR02999 family)
MVSGTQDPATGLGALMRQAEALQGQAPPELFGALYRELHRLAESLLRRSGGTLGATTLLHEAYLDLAGREVDFPDRARFLGYAARAMRGLIIDHARARRALKRGGAFHFTGLDTSAGEQPAEDLPALGDALEALAGADPRLAELVDLKFFCGFSLPEIAAMRGVSERTAQRDWDKARLFLHRQLAG